MDEAAFAAARGARLARADEELSSLVRESLTLFPADGWDEPIVTGAQVLWLEMFSSESPRSYPDATLRRFREELAESIAKTSEPSDPPDPAQIARVARWVGTYTVNHATYHASRANGHRAKKWVTRQDDAVREIHRVVNGQTVPIGSRFDIAGSKLRFPGDPVGPAENWIECRCLVQAVGRGIGMSSITAAAGGEEFEERTGVVIVALPAESDPVAQASSEDVAHITMVWLGDLSELEGKNVDVNGLKANLEQWAQKIDGPVTEGVSGSAVLGADQASVVLVDAKALAEIRNGMIADFAEYPEGRLPEVGEDELNPIASAYHQTEQFPTWIPHVTLGYPESPAAGEYAGTEITFDRLALWVGNERTEFPMGASITAAGTAIDEEIVEEPVVDAPVDDELAPTEPGEPGDIEEDLGIPFHGVAYNINKASGDGRWFQAADWRELPLPFMFQPATSGDPHGGAIRAGIIDYIEVMEDGDVRYSGWANKSAAAQEMVEGIVFGDVRSVSVDLGAMEMDTAAAEEMGLWVVAPRAQIAAITAVPVGAFEEAWIALGTWADAEACMECSEDDEHVETQTDEEDEALIASAMEAAPGTKDGPGWITDPIPTARIRRYWTHGEGALKIRWGAPGDFNRCRKQLAKYIQNPEWLAGACANMHKEATGFWPGREGGRNHLASKTDAPPINLVAAASVRRDLPAEWFANPQLTEPTQMTITEDGRIYGHLATWGTCHIGIEGVCTTPPASATNYAFFHTGNVETDQGDVSVGHLTMGIGHATISASAAAATAHYDKSDAMVADVVMGEDGIGIWYSGALRANVDEDKRRELKATGAVSGDWRRMRAALELVGAVVVGVPGFPIPRASLAASGGHQDALIASGIVGQDQGDEIVAAGVKIKPSDVKQMLGLVDALADEMEHRATRREKIAAVRAKEASVREVRIARAKKI